MRIPRETAGDARTFRDVTRQLASTGAPAPASDTPAAEDEEKPAPQVDEALRILADLIRLQEPSDG